MYMTGNDPASDTPVIHPPSGRAVPLLRAAPAGLVATGLAALCALTALSACNEEGEGEARMSDDTNEDAAPAAGDDDSEGDDLAAEGDAAPGSQSESADPSREGGTEDAPQTADGEASEATRAPGQRNLNEGSEEGPSAGARQSEPSATGDAIEIQPEAPSAGETLKVRAGPLTFANGCEGIAGSNAEEPDEQGTIAVSWRPREVPPDAMCTQALHDMWIETRVEGLEPGEYTLRVDDVGEKTFEVSGAN